MGNEETFDAPVTEEPSPVVTEVSVQAPVKDYEVVNPSTLLPVVDSSLEQAKLLETVGTSGNSELQRSAMYRNPDQVDFLRDHMAKLPKDFKNSVLNIGPANAEEATAIGVLAANNEMLDRTEITYVDVLPAETVKPVTDLGKNIVGTPIPPKNEDVKGFFFDAGTWHPAKPVQEFVAESIKKPDNFWGTAVEDFLGKKKDDPKRYSLVTLNNVAQYLGQGVAQYDNPFYKPEGDFKSFQAVILSVAEKTDMNGLLFASISPGISGKPDRSIDRRAVDKYLRESTNFDEIFDTINPKAGIYRRKSTEPLVLKKQIK
jgi:hypothetical protein